MIKVKIQMGNWSFGVVRYG